MKAITARIPRALPIGARLRCADNTGATEIEIIAIKGYHGVKRRKPACGVASWIIAAVKKGDAKITHEIVNAVIVRQRKDYRRPNGIRIKFEDNAAILINEKGEPRGTRIKGPIAKEVVERYSVIGKIATIVV
jgi:large subunit ribosomal protein L14